MRIGRYDIKGGLRGGTGDESVYVEARTLRVISVVLLVAGLLAVGFAVVLLVRSLTTQPTSLGLPVSLKEGATLAQVRSSGVQVADDRLLLAVDDPTRAEIVLGAAGDVVLALVIGVGALLLRRPLSCTAEGRPFTPGNARRLAFLAVLATTAAMLVPVLPRIATMQALERLELAEADGPLLFGMSFSLTPVVLLPVVLLVLAEAFRQGEKLHRDVEGLV